MHLMADAVLTTAGKGEWCNPSVEQVVVDVRLANSRAAAHPPPSHHDIPPVPTDTVLALAGYSSTDVLRLHRPEGSPARSTSNSPSLSPPPRSPSVLTSVWSVTPSTPPFHPALPRAPLSGPPSRLPEGALTVVLYAAQRGRAGCFPPPL
eukprot:Sspe_Gene.65553::Locus_38796_Transcript_1_4_Confidence_0.667_Length_530::g.65553::m.65553